MIILQFIILTSNHGGFLLVYYSSSNDDLKTQHKAYAKCSNYMEAYASCLSVYYVKILL